MQRCLTALVYLYDRNRIEYHHSLHALFNSANNHYSMQRNAFRQNEQLHRSHTVCCGENG
jgi:hypothetical protein